MSFLVHWATYWTQGEIATGFINTMKAFFAASALTILWAAVVALIRLSPLPALRFLAIAYIEIFRGTPLLVQLLTFFAAIPIVTKLQFPPFETAVIALALNAGAYLAEGYRSGLQAVPSGQREAGLAIGMSKARVFLRVTLPLAVRVILPVVGNTLAGLLLTTSFVFVVGFEDMQAKATDVMNRTSDWSVFVFITLIYVLLGLMLLAFNNWLERNYRPLT